MPGIGHVVGAVGVVDINDILGDDRPFVQVVVDKVRGRPDDLDPAVIRLLIGFGTDKGGKKGVVDVDDALGIVFHKSGSQHPHVFCKYQVVRGVGVDDLRHLNLMGFPADIRVIDVVERDVEFFGQGF